MTGRWILDRYIAREMALPFLFGFGAFTSIAASSDLLGIVRLVVERGAPIKAALKAFMYGMPQIFIWTLPMAALLSTLLAVSRLAGSSELVAMLAGGRSFFRSIKPLLIAAALISAFSLVVNEAVVPHANLQARRVMVEELQGRSLPTIQRNVLLRGPGGADGEWFLHARQFDAASQTMRDVTLVRLEGNRPVETTYAGRVVWDSGGWFMENGVTYLLREEIMGQFGGSRQPLRIDQTPRQIAQRTRNPEEMSATELREHIALLQSQGAEVRSLQVEMHLKYALPMASFVFALLAAPLGAQPHRSASSIGFGLSVILIFVYYILMATGTALGQAGILPPILAAWSQNLLMGGVGALLIWRKAT